MKIGICTVAFSLLLTSPAWAGEVTRTLTGQDGKSVTSTTSTTIDRDNNSVNRSSNNVYSNGKTSSTNSNYTYTNNGDGNSAYTGNVTRTNRNGEVNTATVEGQRIRTNGTVNKTGTVTGSNGNSRTFNNTRSCNVGQCGGERNTTFSNGKTRTVSGSGIRTGKGSYAGNVSVTGRNGNTRSGSFTRTR